MSSLSSIPSTGFTKEQSESLKKTLNQHDFIIAMNASIDAKFNKIIRLLRQQQGLPPAPPVALPALQPAPPPAPPAASPPAHKPFTETPPELPPQPPTPVPAPVPTPAPARSYPPSPSVETIEEVELK